MTEHPMFANDMVEIVDSFVVETKEVFEKLDNEILRLEKNPDDKELINSIFRGVHTVKGTSGFLSFEQMTTIAHSFEDVLNKLRRGDIKFYPAMLDVMLEAFDLMKVLLAQVVERNLQDIDLAPTIKKLQSLASGHQEESVSSTKSDQIQKLDKATDTTIRVDVGRLDQLMNLVGELVLGRNRLSQIALSVKEAADKDFFISQLNETSTQIDFITTELQAAVMKTRMIQIGRVFNRFPRLVRDIAREFDKEIDLVIEGEETELDKSIIEEISDPLVHLIRNAADHGIESGNVREKSGKPRRGTVHLSAGHEGNHVIIQVTDDGAGIDPEKLKQKGLEKGLITADESHEMKTEDAYNLIFVPGFSTAQVVSNVSGRGVGMDVVRTNITKLNGIISIESAVGKGTKFTLKLPLTLAIIQGLLVGVGGESFAIPLASVLEVVHTSKQDISTVHGREVIRLRETVLPLLHISDILDVPPREDVANAFYTVVVGVANHRFGIVVDRLIGQKEIVIKPLGSYLRNISGIAGSTILGDGKVVMIIDTGELLGLAQKSALRLSSIEGALA